MKPTDCAAAIKRHAHELGFDLVGITAAASPPHPGQFRDWLQNNFHGEMGYLQRRADERCDPRRVLPGARSIIVAAMNYFVEAAACPAPAVVPSGGVAHAAAETAATTPVGRVARYAWGERDYHDVMGEKLKQLTAFIRCLPNSAAQAPGRSGTRALWYVDTGPILERDLAQRAGIGFIGKHTNLISRPLGNWIFLGEVLTNLELPADAPEREYCGACHRCMDACPTRAIVGPYQLDARLCISYLTIESKGAIPVALRPLVGDRIFGCDDCLEACPWNRFARQSPVREFRRRELPPLTRLLSWDEQKFRDFFRGTPIFRIKRGGLLRNVCVALGNVGDESALPALERALNDPEPLAREHAQWAIDQIRKRRYNSELTRV